MTALPFPGKFLWVFVVILTSIIMPNGRTINAAGKWYVSTSGSDFNLCDSPAVPCATINAAIEKASDGDTIFVSTGSYTGIGPEVVLLNKSLVLSGGWNKAFSAQSGKSTIDGEESRRALSVTESASASIERFVVQNGFSDRGGGVDSRGNLIFDTSIVSHNASSESGGGVMVGQGTLTLINSTVSGNESIDGGGIFNTGTLTISNSAISGNTAGGGGGVYNFGIAIVNNSTISGNQVNDRGGGIFNLGSTTLNNTTVTQNISTLPDPASCGSPFCTGGGIYNQSGSITIQNTIVAGNFANRGAPDCGGTLTSLGYNLIGNNLDCTLHHFSDLLNVDPYLFPRLIGSPGYHPLARTSPAVNAGNPDGCRDHLGNLLDTDQRGVSRVGRCDIGSYEYDPAADPLSYVFLPVAVRNPSCSSFIDEFDDPSSGWPEEDSETVLIEYAYGGYRILVRPDHWGVLAHPGFEAVDYTVTVDLQNPAGSMGSYGIAFGIAGDFSTFYTLEIYPDSWYGIYRWDPNDIEVLSEAFSSAIYPGSATNRIKVERDGASIKAYANGQLLANVTDDTYRDSRYIGLAVFSYNQPNMDIRFDNFTAYSFSCGGLNSFLSTAEGWPASPGQRSFDFGVIKKRFAIQE